MFLFDLWHDVLFAHFFLFVYFFALRDRQCDGGLESYDLHVSIDISDGY